MKIGTSAPVYDREPPLSLLLLLIPSRGMIILLLVVPMPAARAFCENDPMSIPTDNRSADDR